MLRALVAALGLASCAAPAPASSPHDDRLAVHAPDDVFAACQQNAPACHHAIRVTDCHLHREACLPVYEVDFDGDGQREVVVPWFGGVRVYAPDAPGCPRQGPFDHPACGRQLFGRGIDSEPDQTRWHAVEVEDVEWRKERAELLLRVEDEGAQWRERLFWDGGRWQCERQP